MTIPFDLKNFAFTTLGPSLTSEGPWLGAKPGPAPSHAWYIAPADWPETTETNSLIARHRQETPEVDIAHSRRRKPGGRFQIKGSVPWPTKLKPSGRLLPAAAPPSRSCCSDLASTSWRWRRRST